MRRPYAQAVTTHAIDAFRIDLTCWVTATTRTLARCSPTSTWSFMGHTIPPPESAWSPVPPPGPGRSEA